MRECEVIFSRALSGAQLLIEALKAEGTGYVFGVSGSATLPILDVIYNESQLRYIQAQHEQGAIYMANGYARAARALGICLVSPGPGTTNCLSGVGQAFYTSTPSLLIGIEESTQFHGLGSGLAWSEGQEVILDLADLLAMPVAATRDNKGRIPNILEYEHGSNRAGR